MQPLNTKSTFSIHSQPEVYLYQYILSNGILFHQFNSIRFDSRLYFTWKKIVSRREIEREKNDKSNLNCTSMEILIEIQVISFRLCDSCVGTFYVSQKDFAAYICAKSFWCAIAFNANDLIK